jgi:hypothetical protein
MSTVPARTLAGLRAEWDAPFPAGPSDEAASAARGQLTRELAAAILGADLYDAERGSRTKVGDLFISSVGWSRARADAAAAIAEPGSAEWRAALGTPERATLTSDGLGVNRGQWCQCGHEDAGEWGRYEYWTAGGREGHGFVHAYCRRLMQAG